MTDSGIEGAGESERIDREELFRFVFGSLVDLYKWYQTLIRDVVVFTLLVIGWMITSRYSRGYVREHPPVLYIALGLVLTMFALFVVENLKTLRLSRAKMKQLRQLDYTDAVYYGNYEITPTMLIMATTLVGVVFSLLGVVLATV